MSTVLVFRLSRWKEIVFEQSITGKVDAKICVIPEVKGEDYEERVLYFCDIALFCLDECKDKKKCFCC